MGMNPDNVATSFVGHDVPGGSIGCYGGEHMQLQKNTNCK